MTEDKKDENIISSEENEENVEKIDNQPEVDQNLSNPPDQNENINRDNLNQANLSLRGWKIIIIWECQLKGDKKKFMRDLLPN